MVEYIDRISRSVEETMTIARGLAGKLRAGDIIALHGPVGAGKTHFVMGLASGLQAETPVKSPSFSLINEYPGKIPLYHIDLYRLDSALEIEDLGWTDYLNSGGIVVIEWAEKVKNLLPVRTLDVYLGIKDENSRKVRISADDNFGNR